MDNSNPEKLDIMTSGKKENLAQQTLSLIITNLSISKRFKNESSYYSSTEKTSKWCTKFYIHQCNDQMITEFYTLISQKTTESRYKDHPMKEMVKDLEYTIPVTKYPEKGEML